MQVVSLEQQVALLRKQVAALEQEKSLQEEEMARAKSQHKEQVICNNDCMHLCVCH